MRCPYDKGGTPKNIPHISEADQVDSDLFDGYGTSDASIVSKAYSISADSPMVVHVYYPNDKIDFKKDINLYRDDFKCGTATKNENGEMYYTATQEWCNVGDYVYSSFSVRNDISTTFEFLSDK